ncbi:MAG: hypothetical protein KDE56_19125 [Anaerolineales bacterium]|nr:hypothetical protein [Anaerolineales bacterium]
MRRSIGMDNPNARYGMTGGDAGNAAGLASRSSRPSTTHPLRNVDSLIVKG